VGSGPVPSSADEPWRTIMEFQNTNLIELLRAIQTTASDAGQRKAVQLPKFNPDKTGEIAL